MSIDWNKVYNKAADKMTTRVPTAAPSAGKQTTPAADYDKEMARLQEVRRQAQVDMDMDTVNAADNAMKELRASAGKQTFGDRAGDVVGAAAAGTVGGIANAVNTVQELAGAKDVDRRLAGNAAKDSQRFTQSAKEGFGGVGQFAVDAGVSGLQLLGDAAASALVPGAGLAVMGTRSFGSGAQEARQSGASVGQQALYGLGSAATSVLTEKLSNVSRLFGKTFGAGVLDKALSKLTAKPMGKLVTSALSEGGEEFLEAAVQPLLKQLTYDPDAAYDADWLADALYSFAVGGILGGFGGGVDVVTAGKAQDSATPSAGLRATERTGVSSSEEKTPVRAVSAPSAPETNEGLAAAQIMAQEMAAQEKAAPKAGAASKSVDIMEAEAQRLFGQEKTALESHSSDLVNAVDPMLTAVLDSLKLSSNAVDTQTDSGVITPAMVNYDVMEMQAIRREAKTFRNVIAGFDTKVSEFFNKWRNGRVSQQGEKLEKLYLGKMPETVRQQVSAILGYEMDTRDFIVTNDDVKHILDRHGNAAAEVRQGNIPIEQWMLDALPDIVTAPDTISPGHIGEGKKNAGKQAVVFSKFFPGGTVITVQFDNKGRGTMEINTLYANKNKGTTSKLDTATVTAPNSTSETLEPVPSVDSTITHPSDSVNTAGGGMNAVGAAAGGLDSDYARLQAQSRSFHPEGANVAEGRHVEVPTKDFEGRNISRFASNAMGAKALSEDTVQAIERLVAAGALSDDVQTNTETMRRAEDEINKITVGGAMERLRNAAATGETSPELMGMMEALLVDAEAKGDGARKSELLYLGARLSRSSGRSLQMLSHLRKMDPAYQLQIIDRLVESVNKDIASKRSAAPKKKATRNPNTDTSRRHRQISSGNVPVEQWMEKTGELLARKLGSAVKKNTATEQTVSQRVLADLRRLAKETVEPAKRAAGSRTEMDSIYDMFHNQEQYEKALAAAKATVADEYGSDPAVMAALEQWMQTAFDYTTQFTKAVTGQEAIRVPEDLRQRYLAAETAQQRNEVISDIQQYVADNIPSTVGDVFTAIRYTNMLGNLKTPIRNTVGNVSMRLLAEINNAIAAGIEQAAGGKVGRTRSVVVNRNLLNAAKADYDAHKDSIEGARRYSDSLTATDAFMQGVQDKRRVIQLPGMFGRSENSSGVKKAVRKAADTVLLPMEAYRKGTSWIMDNQFFGDTAFLKGSYARSLAGYLKANGVTAAQFTDPAWQAKNGDLVKDARTFAVQQAKENTFRDNNSLSDWVSKVGRRKDTPWYARMVAEGFMPFRKTPANVLVRAEEYSPLGFVNATVKALQKANGAKVTGNDIVNSLSKALTGSALFGLGWLLKNTGWLRSTEEDEEQASFDDLTGHQDYSMILPDGTSLTVDWLTPTSMPVFMGAKLSEILQDNDLSWKDVESVITSMADPMLQMSMLSGVQDTLDDIKFSDNSTIQLVVSTALGYLTQGLSNTLLGQLERATQDTRKTTYVEHDSSIPDWLQREIGSLFGKIPGKDFQQIDYIDAWGRTEENFEDPLVRVLYETMSPSYISKVDVDAVETELQRLKDSVPDEEDLTFFPSRAAKSFEVAGETKYLTAEEYVSYAKAKGQNSYALVQSAIHSPAYKAMGDAEKAAFVTKMYGYANYKAKKAVVPEYESDTYRKYAEAEAVGMSPVEYYVMTSTYDYDGSSSTGQPTQAEAQRYLDTETNLTKDQKADLWTIINKSWTKNNPYA